MTTPQIDNIRSILQSHKGIAKSERFYVQIFPPIDLVGITAGLSTDLIYQCEAAELPGTLLNTTDYRTIGPVRRIATQVSFNELSLSFYCTADFYEKPFFDAWIEYINPRSLGWDFRYKSEYASNIQICQLDQTGDNIIYAVELVRAFPITTHALATHWQDDSIHRLNVTFSYDRYKPITTYNNMFESVLALAASTNNGLNFPNPLNINNTTNQPIT